MLRIKAATKMFATFKTVLKSTLCMESTYHALAIALAQPDHKQHPEFLAEPTTVRG